VLVHDHAIQSTLTLSSLCIAFKVRLAFTGSIYGQLINTSALTNSFLVQNEAFFASTNAICIDKLILQAFAFIRFTVPNKGHLTQARIANQH
jgi:uncharacterized membrane protein